jgi:epoxyqueuosine reductase
MEQETGRTHSPTTALSRRDLLMRVMIAAACLPAAAGKAAGPQLAAAQRFGTGERRRGREAQRIDPSQIPAYAYSTLPVGRFPALQTEYDRTLKSGGISRHRAFRDQVAPLSFALPPDFQDARSVVIVAAFSKTMYATFRLNGRPYRILVPFQYYVDDLDAESLRGVVQKEVVREPVRRVVDITKRVPLKLLAARSGLGRYGLNNLIFVDGMGSFNVLYAFLTDHQFRDDRWSDLTVLDRCRHCDRCDRTCPTTCITRDNFVIDIDRCITLYNENAGAFPTWILPSMHHALMGCMKCQSPCPVNEGILDVSGDLDEVSEEETRRILQGDVDEALLKTLQRKLRQFPAVATRQSFPVLTRNLRALVRA